MPILRPCLKNGAWRILIFSLFGLVAAVRAADAPSPAPLCALLVGGGPDVENNAAQIEGHVRFVASLLPPSAKRTVLFADGKTSEPTVTYAETGSEADAQRALAILLADHDADEPVLTRRPELGVPVDGPARLENFRRALAKLATTARKPPAPFLLYFAGHGSRNERDEQNTCYDLWEGDTLKVRALADELARLPRQTPLVLVMAQCFSGAFAHAVLRAPDAKNTATEPPIAGFSRRARTGKRRVAPTRPSARTIRIFRPISSARCAAGTASAAGWRGRTATATAASACTRHSATR